LVAHVLRSMVVIRPSILLVEGYTDDLSAMIAPRSLR